MTGRDVFIPFGVLPDHFSEHNQVLVSVLFRKVGTFIGDNRKPLNSLFGQGRREMDTATQHASAAPAELLPLAMESKEHTA
jgi:hypothetical protein